MRAIPINVSKKILADISSGIYRTPANALKELVSNAFDAGAHKVYISTNIPYFDVFTCEDDGEGITAKEFERILKIIGSSTKRVEEKQLGKDDRPIIGKIGIGLLAVAQICHKFTIISKKRGTNKYFEATIDLKQFDEVEKEKAYKTATGEISLGECHMEDGLDDEIGPERQYTKIIMENIKEGFQTKLLQEDPKRIFDIKKRAVKSDNFIKFVNAIKEKKFNELSQYDQLIWELGILCPVEYIEEGPLPENEVIKKEIVQLTKYNFKVFIDGFELRKPIKFPTNEIEIKKKNIDYKIYPHLYYNNTVDNTQLTFGGYLFHQRKKIEPAGLQGLLIRIKGVAIGSYDRTFLHYPKAEGPMFNQLSGEIYVEEGLEEALNIDRNSFNEAHSHYLELQIYLWDFLGKSNGVFNDIRSRSKERRDLIHQETSEAEIDKARELVETLFGVNIRVMRSRKEYEMPYLYNKKSHKLTFYQHPFWFKNRIQRTFQEKLVLGVIAAKTVSKSLDDFENTLIKIFSRIK